MNVRIFLFRKEENNYAKRLAGELGCLFADLLPADGICEAEALKDAEDSMTRAFRDSHAILFFAEPSGFAEIKKMLSKTLNMPIYCDAALLEKANARAKSRSGERSDFAVAHAYMPDGAKVLACGDGLYTGFAARAGNQTVYLLPVERGRTETVLMGSVIPDINSVYKTRISPELLKAYNVKKFAQVCDEHDVRIAVAGTNTAKFFRDYLSVDARLVDRLAFADSAERRGTLSPADHIVNLSITAAEFFGTSYGVAISNAFYSGDDPNGEKTIYLAITNEHETLLREVISFPGEDIAAMLSRCCGDLCTFICDIVSTDASRNEVTEQNRKTLTRQYKSAICIVAALVILIGAFGAYYFTKHDYSLKTWFSDAWSYVFPGSAPQSVSEFQTEGSAEQIQN